ncbi:MAG: molybdopterin-binding protein [Acidobacteriota bacterium]
MMNPSAAALVIGNELLTGKIKDLNTAVLGKLLFQLGITLKKVIVCPDEVDTIAEDLNFLRARHDWVFTSGGVGPTHDDVTLHAISQAFERPLMMEPGLEAMLREYFGDRLTDDHLSMALVPEGCELVRGKDVRWPTVLVDNVFILPGLPEVFRMKMPILRERLGGGRGFVSRAVPTGADEGEIASLLEGLTQQFPTVSIGSYPHWGRGPVKVTVTFDSLEPAHVDEAARSFLAALPVEQHIAPSEDS